MTGRSMVGVCNTCFESIHVAVRGPYRWVRDRDSTTECRDDAGRRLAERHTPA